jgi:transposase
MARLSKNQISILHYWNNGIRSAHFIHRETKISLSTVKYNIKKLKETKSLKHRAGNGRPPATSSSATRAIGQYIRRNNETTLKEIKEKLLQTHQTSVSLSTISRHLNDYGYRSVLPIKNSSTTMFQNESISQQTRQT